MVERFHLLGSDLVLSGKLPCVPEAKAQAQAPSWTPFAKSLSPLVARAFLVVVGGEGVASKWTLRQRGFTL